MSPIRKATLLVSIALILIAVGAMYSGWVNQLHEGLPLKSQIVTDKNQYRVGENIEATLLYVNPNPFNVRFTPPSSVYTQMRKYPDSTTAINNTPEEAPGSVETVWGNIPWMVLGANQQFNVVSYTFTAVHEGSFLIVLANVTKIIEITN